MLEQRQVQVTKEIDDVMVLFVQLVHNRRKGEEIGGLVDELVKAIDGADDIDDEAREHRKVALQTIGYRSGELVDAFLPQKEEVKPLPTKE